MNSLQFQAKDVEIAGRVLVYCSFIGEACFLFINIFFYATIDYACNWWFILLILWISSTNQE